MQNKVKYDINILYRYLIDISFSDELVDCIVDTGCVNTLVPLYIAKAYGKRLNFQRRVVVGGKEYSSTLYLFTDVQIGDFTINKMSAFAADFEGNIKDRVLLGLNIINNLKILLDRSSNYIEFDYMPYNSVKGKKYPFASFFDPENSKLTHLTNLLVEETI